MVRNLLVFISLLWLYACDGNVKYSETEGLVSTRAIKTDVSSIFDSVTNPKVWRTFQSLEEMQEACQVPNEILKKNVNG